MNSRDRGARGVPAHVRRDRRHRGGRPLFGAVTRTERQLDEVGLAFTAAVGVVGFLLRWALEQPAGAPRGR
jgi:hypothetical protein